MSDTINIQEILKKNNVPDLVKMKVLDGEKGSIGERVQSAIKEIVETVVDKCAEEFNINQLESWGQKTGETEIDKKSILKVKQMIDYE